MSAATVARHTPPPSDAWRKRRHRLWIQLGIAAGTLATVALCVYGLSYYILPADARLLSPRHDALKPSGSIGNALGIVGGVMWMIGSISNFVAASVVGPAIGYALGKAPPWWGRFGASWCGESSREAGNE